MGEVSFTFRVDQALKDDFVRTAKSRDLNASQILRMHMRDFVQEQTPAEGYDEWLAAKVERSAKSLDAGQRLTSAEVEARFSQWRRSK